MHRGFGMCRAGPSVKCKAMRTVLHTLITLVWGLWFGGMACVFIVVTAIFNAFPADPSVAGQAAAHVFRSFNVYQLVLAAAALLATFFWCLAQRGKMKLGLFLLFGLATVDACIITRYLAPSLERLQQQHLTHTPDFGRLHAYSMTLYLAEAVLLLVSGLFLPWLRESNK